MKSYKVILGIFTAALVVALLATGHFLYQPAAKISLTAPTTCKIGELIELDASSSIASSFTWRVIPETPNFRIIERGKKALFCSESSGKYLFVLAAVNQNTVDCKIHVIVVGLKVKIKVTNSFNQKIRSWLPDDSDPKIVEKLAKSFERVAAAGHNDITILVKVTALSNRGILGSDLVKYKPFLVAFSDYLKDNYANENIEKHIELWFMIASALRE